jgi:2-iminoacetate synthase ThiH
VCTYACGFCAFSKGRVADEARDAAYLLDLNEIQRRVAEAWDRGATEVCLQGGIHPEFTGDTYLRILDACKDAVPEIHVCSLWLRRSSMNACMDEPHACNASPFVCLDWESLKTA